jgi:ribonuclease M5
MKMTLTPAVVVEGKYDAAKLAGIVDGMILTTDGFAVFRDRSMQQMLQQVAQSRGLLILTDSDDAGFRIRHFVTGLAGAEHVLQAFIPAIPGKERRKPEPGKEGLLGVEGVPCEIILNALQTALAAGESPLTPSAPHVLEIEYRDLYEWGLSGRKDCAEFRRCFLRTIGLPPRVSKKELLQLLNTLFTRDSLARRLESFCNVEKKTVPEQRQKN